MKHETITSLLKTPIFDVGTRIDYDFSIGFNPTVVSSSDWVSVIVEQNSNYLAVKQLRYGIMEKFEEFPCGMVEDGESPVDAAVRELYEETGYQIDAKHLKYLGCFAANPAFMTNHMHYFYVNLRLLGDENYKEGIPHPDLHEKLEVYWKDKMEMFQDFMNGKGSSLMAGAYLRLSASGLLQIFCKNGESLLLRKN